MNIRTNKIYQIIKNQNKQSDTGFTIVEMALVMLIGAVLLGAISTGLVAATRQAQLTETKDKIEQIDQAMQLHLNLNGRFPCVADPQAQPDTINFGVEVSANCDTVGAVGGAFTTAGRDGRNVMIGAVPTRTLNLPDDYQFDAWGNRFTMAMTARLAEAGGYNREEGAIFVNDSAGNPVVLNPAGSAHYITYSHGPSAQGATSFQGVAIPGVACSAAATMDGENCDGDATFINTMITSNAAGVNFYDDVVGVRAAAVFGQEVPSGSVVAFNLAACPDGWADFPLANGRTIIGAGDYAETFSDGGAPRAVRNDWSVNETFAVGDTGGFAEWQTHVDDIAGIGVQAVDLTTIISPLTPNVDPGIFSAYIADPTATTGVPGENRSPFITLLYCQKT